MRLFQERQRTQPSDGYYRDVPGSRRSGAISTSVLDQLQRCTVSQVVHHYGDIQNLTYSYVVGGFGHASTHRLAAKYHPCAE